MFLVDPESLGREICAERFEQLASVINFLVRQRNSIFLKKRAIASIENVFVYSDRYGHSDLKSD